MNFGFDEQQKELGETVARVLADFPALTAPDPASETTGVWRALADLGLFALLAPERADGAGLTLVDLALAVEALGGGLAPPTVVATLAATDAIVRHGSDAQQRALLPSIAAGTVSFAIAVLEADRGYDPAALADGLADRELSCAKIAVAGAAGADMLLVVTRRGGQPALLLVERTARGVSVRPHESIDASSALAAVRFDRVAIDENALLGQASPERGVARLLDVAGVLHAGLSIGIAARMLDAAVDYARTRVQFGQPIGAFQAIKHRCADMAVAVEAGRSAAYYAFWAMAEDAPDRVRAASMAKAYCGEVARNACNETIQIHGGMGFTWELGLHRYLRRSKVIEHAFGDARYHYERVLAETLVGAGDAADRRRDAA